MTNYGIEILFWFTLSMAIFYLWEENNKYKPAKKKRGKRK